MVSSGRYWCVGITALLLLALLNVVAAVVTPLEERSLQEVLDAFPDLERVSSYDSYPDSLSNPDGFSWNPDFQPSFPTGYYGMSSGDGYGPNIEFSDAWGTMQKADLPGFGNFPLDSSVTIAAASTQSTNQFWQAIMTSNRSLTHLSQFSAYMDDDWSTTEEKSSLVYLVGALPGNFNLSNFRSLQTFHSSGPKPYYEWTSSKVDCSAGFVDHVNGFSAVNRTLLYLETFCESVTPRVWADVTEELGILSYWGCDTCHWSLNTRPMENTINFTMLPSFSSIDIKNPQGAATTAKFFFEGSGFREIRLYDFPSGSSIDIGYTPSLIQLKLVNVSALPEGLLDINGLEEMEISISSSSWLNTIPGIIANQSRLNTLRLEGPFDTQSLQNALCNISSTLISIVQISISSSSPSSIVWPSCTLSMAISRLTVKANRQFDYADFMSKIPLWSISELSLTNMFDISVNSSIDLTKFYGVETLRILSIKNNNLTGEIPEIFVASCSSLQSLDFSGNAFHGNVPFTGLSRLSKLYLQRNAFTAWPDPQGQSGLQVVDLSYNQLAMIPNDSLLLNLETFSIAHNPTLSGPLPGFWAESINLLRFDASGCSFSGPMQSPVENSRLHTLSLANNYLCGPLPDVPISAMDLSGNRLTGSIPMSWVNPNYTIVSLNLKGNYFDGTVPRDLFSTRTLIRASLIDLSDSNWHGPMFNLSKLGLSLNLNLQGSNFDLCSEDPAIPSSSHLGRYTPTCNLPAFGHCGCASYYASCRGLSTCSGSPAAFQPRNDPYGPTCVAFPPGPVPQVIPCNPPAGFRCSSRTGEIILDGDLSEPNYEVPDGFDTVIVNGNINADTVVFRGTTSSLRATGCISTGKVVVEVSELKATKSKVIMSQSGSNCTQSLADVIVSVTAPSSCKKVVPNTSGSTKATLNLAFTIDNKSCNTKWIILGSVLGAALVLGVVGVILLVKFNPKVRLFFLPYEGANS